MLKSTHDIFFGTLANEKRFTIVTLLQKGDKNVTQICRSLKFNQTTVSHNLARLEECGFVTFKRNGKEIIYSLNKETIKPLLDLINKHMNKYCKKLCKNC